MSKLSIAEAIAKIVDQNEQAMELIQRSVAKSNQALRVALEVLSDPDPEPEKPFMDVNECAMRTTYAKGYIYQLVSRHQIPFIRRGRKIVFETASIDAWLRKHAVRTNDELRGVS